MMDQLVKLPVTFIKIHFSDVQENLGLCIDSYSDLVTVYDKQGIIETRPLNLEQRMTQEGAPFHLEFAQQTVGVITRLPGGKKEIEYECKMGKFRINTETFEYKQYDEDKKAWT